MFRVNAPTSSGVPPPWKAVAPARHHQVVFVFGDAGGQGFPVACGCEREQRPRVFQHIDGPRQLAVGPGGQLVSELHPELAAWPFVFDHEDVQRLGDGQAQPRLPGGQVEGQIDRQRGLACAAVAVQHQRPSGGQDRVVVVAQQRDGGRLVNGGELVDGGTTSGSGTS
jgi:hypothetical protein